MTRPGTILATRLKGCATWIARIGQDRGRLEVVAVIPPSAEPVEIEPLTDAELRELLGEGADPNQQPEQTI